jgi:dTDP-4-dehydrorhamnose reductase
MKILILGCKGQLGLCLKDQLAFEEYEVFYTSRDQIDISNLEVTKDKILQICPDVIVNASAFTAVDQAEEKKEAADWINNIAVANIASICNEMNCWLIHISSDYVFDGNSHFAYKEKDKPNPKGIYGQTKLDGDIAIQQSGCKFIIIRTAWVYSEYGNNFLKTMLSLGLERDELSIVSDQIGCPTYAQDIAKVIISIFKYLHKKADIVGIYNYAGSYGCSWAEFAEDIFNEAIKKNIIRDKPKIIKIKTFEFPTLAKRPMRSELDCSKIKEVFKINPSDYKRGIFLALEAYKKKA